MATLGSVSRGATNHDCRRGAPILLCQSDFSRAARADSTKSRPDPQLSGCGECFPERPRGFERTDFTEFLPRIAIPTLVIAGREDLGASPAEAQFIAEHVPDARLVVVEEANHLVPLEKPRQVAEEMRKFLKGLSLDC